ncbi:MAG: DNA cytosine methyltransferase [Oryzihumus sp.]
MKYAGTFEGIGGFSVGFHAAGMTPTAFVEWDANCQKVLKHHYPHVPLLEDICGVNGTAIGRPDLVCGGFPCQDVSIAAPHRAGLAGARSGMFFEFTRLVEEHLRLVDATRPRWVVIENTPGLLTSPGRSGRDMAVVVRGLEDIGYGWAYRVVDSRHTGSAQRRQRVLVVGHRGGDPRPAWAVLGDDGAGVQAARPRALGEARGPQAVVHPGDLVIWRKSARARASLSKGGYETWVESDFSNTLTGFDAGNATRQTHLVSQNGRLRTLTLLEWERLQNFPDHWTAVPGNPDSARFQQLGNAMNVGMATWLGRRLMAVDATLPLIGAT